MKSVIKVILYYIAIVLLIFFIPWYILYNPVVIKPELVLISNTYTGDNITHWQTIRDKEQFQHLFADKEDLPEIDFNKYNLIVSYGKEIKSIAYRRISTFQHTFSETTYIGDAEYGVNNGNHIYFYQIKKVNVIYDFFSLDD